MWQVLEQAMVDKAVSFEARSLYVFLCIRKYRSPTIKEIAFDTGLSNKRVSYYLSELIANGWLTRREPKPHKVVYDFDYSGHPALHPPRFNP
jgi:DNA-binding MarR family transcriptional regulator